MFFCWGHVGLVVLLFLCCFSSLGSNPSLFLFVFGFLGVLGDAFVWFGFVCSFGFEKGLVFVCS